MKHLSVFRKFGTRVRRFGGEVAAGTTLVVFSGESSAALTTTLDAMVTGFTMDNVKEGALTIGGILLGIVAIIVAVKIVLGMAKGGV